MLTQMSKSRRNLVRYLIPLQLWESKALFGDGRINFNKLFFKTLRLAPLRRLGSTLFHSMKVDGKKEFLKKLRLVRNRVTLSVLLVL